jgi:hypothetical protein
VLLLCTIAGPRQLPNQLCPAFIDDLSIIKPHGAGIAKHDRGKPSRRAWTIVPYNLSASYLAWSKFAGKTFVSHSDLEI